MNRIESNRKKSGVDAQEEILMKAISVFYQIFWRSQTTAIHAAVSTVLIV